ncbi:FHA domain-containing protein [Luteipulveratus mongoliensis]|uniref:FHA domain-containing protein n=1 Tax=Luteipulveratus mongoliensis TaxID=571913 RepID=A0A0K1JNH4_9MICO|nr:FHA domain-containing protein [Luteipulveratus mongoliensis]AKU18246.1 hypothetical protein VV02_24310 [Luteipulveratus mongoliensis]
MEPHPDGSVPGTLFVADGVTIAPQEGLVVRFGRNRLEVDLCIGADDLQVSRVHGTITCRAGQWWLDCTGRSPVQLPNAVLLYSDSPPVPLDVGYTPLSLRSSRGREHVIELYISGPRGNRPSAWPAAETEEPRRWRLSRDERLALAVLGRRYLVNEPHPQPLSRQQAAAELLDLDPDGRWTVKKVEHVVADVRTRLSSNGVFGLRRDEVGEPVGLTLAVNLLRELTSSSTLVPSDLDLLENPDDAPPCE